MCRPRSRGCGRAGVAAAIPRRLKSLRLPPEEALQAGQIIAPHTAANAKRDFNLAAGGHSTPYAPPPDSPEAALLQGNLLVPGKTPQVVPEPPGKAPQPVDVARWKQADYRRLARHHAATAADRAFDAEVESVPSPQRRYETTNSSNTNTPSCPPLNNLIVLPFVWRPKPCQTINSIGKGLLTGLLPIAAAELFSIGSESLAAAPVSLPVSLLCFGAGVWLTMIWWNVIQTPTQ